MEDVILGPINVKDSHFRTFLKFIALEVKWQLWKNRNNVKYGNKQSMNHQQMLKIVLEQCKQQYYVILACKSLKIDKNVLTLLDLFLN